MGCLGSQSKFFSRVDCMPACHFLCQSYNRLKIHAGLGRLWVKHKNGENEDGNFTCTYPLGLAPLSVFHKGTPRLSLLKNGPEAKDCNVAEEERRGLCCWSFLHRAPLLVARSARLPEVATTSERGSCYWQLSMVSFANQFLFPFCCHPRFIYDMKS